VVKNISRIMECGKCGATGCEHVARDGAEFVRCVSCGHEGEKTPTIPVSDTFAVWSKAKDRRQKF
jgi:Na+-translocating ferredoxin:NAD+ oxidoreductase RNF subunit RnfB